MKSGFVFENTTNAWSTLRRCIDDDIKECKEKIVNILSEDDEDQHELEIQVARLKKLRGISTSLRYVHEDWWSVEFGSENVNPSRNLRAIW